MLTGHKTSSQTQTLPLFSSDFDGDDMISVEDLHTVINRLTGEQQLTDEDMDQLIKNVSISFIVSTPRLSIFLLGSDILRGSPYFSSLS